MRRPASGGASMILQSLRSTCVIVGFRAKIALSEVFVTLALLLSLIRVRFGV